MRHGSSRELDRKAEHVEPPVPRMLDRELHLLMRICGSSNTSRRVITRPHGTPAAFRTSSQCSIGCLRVSSLTSAR